MPNALSLSFAACDIQSVVHAGDKTDFMLMSE
jgi:hypothetical protein